ncbi:hypothetical protein NHQ30_007076 [Ciborinia camelliae]|nr:hypothetical protein NHQ30_007076 [Ciborinia camelliae]
MAPWTTHEIVTTVLAGLGITIVLPFAIFVLCDRMGWGPFARPAPQPPFAPGSAELGLLKETRDLAAAIAENTTPTAAPAPPPVLFPQIPPLPPLPLRSRRAPTSED